MTLGASEVLFMRLIEHLYYLILTPIKSQNSLYSPTKVSLFSLLFHHHSRHHASSPIHPQRNTTTTPNKTPSPSPFPLTLSTTASLKRENNIKIAAKQHPPTKPENVHSRPKITAYWHSFPPRLFSNRESRMSSWRWRGTS